MPLGFFIKFSDLPLLRVGVESSHSEELFVHHDTRSTLPSATGGFAPYLKSKSRGSRNLIWMRQIMRVLRAGQAGLYRADCAPTSFYYENEKIHCR